MDLRFHLDEWQGRALDWYDSLGPWVPYFVKVACGVLFLIAFTWFVYRAARKLLGHRCFRGTWYNGKQFQELLKIIDEDCTRGNRVMKHDEMKLLRQWRLGGSGEGLADKISSTGGYF
jgi:hypothetical protein